MRYLWLIMLMLCPLQAFAAGPYARASVEDDGKIVPGQQVYVTVGVFVPEFFTSPPQFPLFGIPDALITLPGERSQHLTETADGIQYAGIRTRYAIVPEVPGTYAVPAIDIELGYAVDGRPLRVTVQTNPLSFETHGNATAGAGFAARDLTIVQAFDPDPAALKAGDALTRTITITAGDTQAIMMPPVEAGAAPGLTQYAKPAKTEDGIAIGRDTASRRTETLVYTTTAEGRFAIPPIDYSWFDLDSGGITVARLPSTTVLVAAAPARTGIAPDVQAPRMAAPFEQRQHLMLVILLGLAAGAAAWAMRRLPRALVRYLSAAELRFKTSRRYLLRGLQKSILSADPAGVYTALQAWSREEGFRTLHDWAASGHPDLADEITGLESMLYGGRSSAFDRQRLALLVTSAGDHRAGPHPRIVLPALNPGAGTLASPRRSAFTLHRT